MVNVNFIKGHITCDCCEIKVEYTYKIANDECLILVEDFDTNYRISMTKDTILKNKPASFKDYEQWTYNEKTQETFCPKCQTDRIPLATLTDKELEQIIA